MNHPGQRKTSWPVLTQVVYYLIAAALPVIGTVVLGVKNGASLHDEIGTWRADIEYLAHIGTAGLLTGWFLRRMIRRDGLGNFVMKGAIYYVVLALTAILLIPLSTLALDVFTDWKALGYSMAFFCFSLMIGAFFGIPVAVGMVLVLYPFAPPKTAHDLKPSSSGSTDEEAPNIEPAA